MFDTPVFPDISVLVADEASYARKLVREMLSRVSIRRIFECPDGAEALGALTDMRPDVVILNWDMPIVTGEEFIRLARTKSTSPSPNIPIIVTLANPQKALVERAYALGANEIIIKPFSPKTLWSRLSECIHKEREFIKASGGRVRPAPRIIAA
jgi:two-component system, chemotaxis family, chemotaxis protein CheY